MTTFAELYNSLVEKGTITPAEGCLRVRYPDGFIRSRVLDVNIDLDWVDESPVIGAKFTLTYDIKTQLVGMYKVGGWELVTKVE
jgi:hypothetical protein